MTRRAAAAAAVLLLAGCGSGRAGGGGDASLWITSDRGARVISVGPVSSGLSAMQALRSRARVRTRYGGRFVQAIDGVEGSLAGGRDWFYFVNGIEADRGASEYRLRPGDVEWWDYRPWRGRPEVHVVVGAFPEPFVHGYGGRARPTVVTYARPAYAAVARRLARLVRGTVATTVPARRSSNVVRVVDGGGFRLTIGTRATDPVRGVIGIRAARRLARDAAAFRYRYEVPG